MILVVGHGPSAKVDPEWVDSQDFVVRLFEPSQYRKGVYHTNIGSKIDVIVTTRPKNIFPGIEFWLESDYREIIREMVNPQRKLSTGTVACLIARHKYPEEEIGVIGFDTTLRGWNLDVWVYHDALAERKMLEEIGVKDCGARYEDQ